MSRDNKSRALPGSRSSGDIYIGISGWRYKGWRGVFYPEKLPQRRELEFAAQRFNTIELNGSFYSLQRPESFSQWAAATPPGFKFSVKGSRYLTHMLRLRGIEPPLANFFAQGLLRLGPKLGPILWQFPANFKFEPGRLDAFLSMLPKSHREAAELARLHDHRLDERCWFDVEEDAPLRYAMEIRDRSFVCEEFISLLRRHRVALVAADTVEWPLLMDITADFIYCRLHGSEELYASGYRPEELEIWSRRVAAWSQGGEVHDGERASARSAPRRRHRDVFVYFDNDAKVHAPFDAEKLQELVADRLSRGSAALAKPGADDRKGEVPQC